MIDPQPSVVYCGIMPDHTAIAWRVEVAAWADWMRAAGRAPGTIKVRTRYVHRLATHLEVTEVHPWAVTVDQLAGWLASHQWEPETRHSAVASVRGFYSWAVDVGRLDRSPAAALASVPVIPGRPRPTPEDVLEDALDGADPRTALMVRLAARAGLRRGEIAKVRGVDVERDDYGPILRVMGKGRRERLVPISETLASLIVERAAESASSWAFPGRDEREHMSAGHVGKLITAALPGGWTSHTLRHRFASRAYAGERDIRAVQELLGHTNVAVTQRYTAIPDQALRRAVEHAA